MSQIDLKLVAGGAQVEVTFLEVPTAERGEVEYLLMLAGAEPSDLGLRLDAFAFRRAAPDLAGLLSRAEAAVRWDAGVGSLLQLQLDEVRARTSAEVAEPLSPDEVSDGVGSTGRFLRVLTEGQSTNLGQLLAIPNGANFSVPGAGKTTTLLASYETARGSGLVDRLLVVAPKNAFVSWEDEVHECYPEEAQRPSIVRASGGPRGVEAALHLDPEIVLITYQLLPNVIAVVKAWARRHRTHVALDESHRAKAGYSGVHARAALELAEIAARRDILSGTPLPHQPEDLRPQLDFLWPGQRILPDFKLLSDAPQQVIDEIERRVRPLYVRTTKDQLDLPELVVKPVPIELGPLQRELYELLRSEAARAAAGMSSRDRRMLRSLGRHVVRLIQAATNPMLLTQGLLVDPSERGGSQDDRAWDLLREVARDRNPAKLAKAVELVDSAVAAGEKVLVWSGFVMNLHVLEERLSHHNPVVIYGQVPTGAANDDDTREGRIRLFHEDPSCRVMVANPAAAGEGISLHHACRYAIYLDRSFNAAHYMQSVDRIHRLGSDQACRVDVLQASGTIDVRIQERLSTKVTAMAQILNDQGLRALAYDPEDVDEPFDGGIGLDDLEDIIEHLTAEENGD